jgi:hypothetical protein
MSHVSEDKRNNICALLLEGLSLRAIAERCHVSRTTVSKIRKKYYPDLAHPPAGRSREYYRTETVASLYIWSHLICWNQVPQWPRDLKQVWMYTPAREQCVMPYTDPA